VVPEETVEVEETTTLKEKHPLNVQTNAITDVVVQKDNLKKTAEDMAGNQKIKIRKIESS
jgi:hypothetical protein